jgi:hypothetical protein
MTTLTETITNSFIHSFFVASSSLINALPIITMADVVLAPIAKVPFFDTYGALNYYFYFLI